MEENHQIDTSGGTYTEGDINTGGGDFIGRDKVVKAEKGGVAIDGNVQDATIITGDTYGDIHIHQGATLPEISPPPQPQVLPKVEGFVGREKELDYFTDKLKFQNLAVISGMPGVGKTWLAGQLAQSNFAVSDIFWHTFFTGDGIDTIIWKLAAFLAWHGSDEIWKTLQSTQLSGGATPPPDVLYDYLFQNLQSKPCVICLDDFQFVEDDPQLEKFAARLQRALSDSAFSVIITTHRLPTFLRTTDFKPLDGLTLEDTLTLLKKRNIQLTENQFHALHDQTNGNAQFLALAIDALQRKRNPDRLIERLVEADDIERFLIHEVDEAVDEEGRSTMNGIAALLGYPSLRDAIEATLDGGNLRRVLRDLTDRYLVNVQEGEDEREYFQTKLIKNFYYDSLSRRERRAMHGNAGDYYENDEPDVFKAALHYQKSGEYERAAELVIQDIEGLLNLGFARPLRELLENFRERQLSSELWVKVKNKLGHVLIHLGEFPQAQECFHETLRVLAGQPNAMAVREQRIFAYQSLGEIMQYEFPKDALNWFQYAFEEADNEFPREAAIVQAQRGSVLLDMGESSSASDFMLQGLALLPAGPNQWRIDVLIGLGRLYGMQGNMESAIIHTSDALSLSQRLNDPFRMINCLTNLSLTKFYSGDWAGAIADNQQAVELAAGVGNISQQTRLTLNSGWMMTQSGDDVEAEAHLATSLTLARKHEIRRMELLSISNLADLQVRTNQFEIAQTTLNAAEQLAEETQISVYLPEIYRNRALIHLAQANPEQALQAIEYSLSLAREMNANAEIGMDLRVLGQVRLATGNLIGANEAFENSVEQLTGDPYEIARTQTQWALALLAEENPQRGKERLEEARSTFELLGAKRDLVIIQNIMEDIQ